MKVLHYMKKEQSGLARTTLELVKYEERLGHQVILKSPGDDVAIYGIEGDGADIEIIHSQLPSEHYFNQTPKLMLQHGEPLSSVGNGISMKAICDLSSRVDAFICMRKTEWPIWSLIKRTYLVRKGIDLEVYKPYDGITEKLPGEPSILYYENMRGTRNPLYLLAAMPEIFQKFPKARLYIYGVTDQKMSDTFQAFLKTCKLWAAGVTPLQGPVDDVPLLLNRIDIVVSCLYPLIARSIEAFGVGKALIAPGYDNEQYPWHCTLSPESIAEAVIACWSDYDKIDYRQHAIGFHNVEDMAKECLAVYERYAS